MSEFAKIIDDVYYINKVKPHSIEYVTCTNEWKELLIDTNSQEAIFDIILEVYNRVKEENVELKNETDELKNKVENLESEIEKLKEIADYLLAAKSFETNQQKLTILTENKLNDTKPLE